MKQLTVWVGLLLVAVQAWAAPALPLLVEDNAFGYVHVPSLNGLKAKAEKSPFAKMWKDEKVQKFIAPALQKMEFQEWDSRFQRRVGISLREAGEMLRGELLLTVVQRGERDPAALLLVDLGADGAKFQDLVLKAFSQADGDEAPVRMQEEEVAGTRIHEFITETPAKDDQEGSSSSTFWFVRDGIFAISPEKDLVEGVAGSLVRGAAVTPLARSDRFQRDAALLQGEGLRVLFDFNQISPLIVAKAKESQEGKPIPPMLSAEAVLNSLGIGELDTFNFAFRLDDASATTEGRINWRDAKGLVRLLAFKPGPVSQPSFVPQKWIAVSSLRYSLGDVFTAVKETLQSHNPATAGLFAANMAAVNAKMGFDLERDLFGSLGDDIILANAPRPGIPTENLTAFDLDRFFSISLTNPKAFTSVLEGALKQMDPQSKGMVNRRDYLGVNIATLQVPPDELGRPRTVSLCVWRNYFFLSIGSPAALEAAVRTGSQDEPNFWQVPNVKAALDKIPAESCGFSFQDNRSSTAMIIETLVRAVEMATAKQEEKVDLLDRSSQPTADDLAKYWDYSYGYLVKESQSLKIYSTVPYLP